MHPLGQTLNKKLVSYQNWETINNYKYSAIRDADKLIIKIILSNILFCEVMFFDLNLYMNSI